MRYILYLLFFLCSTLLKAQGFKVRHSIPNASANSTKALFEISPGNYIGAGFVIDTSSGQAINCIAYYGIRQSRPIAVDKKIQRSQD